MIMSMKKFTIILSIFITLGSTMSCEKALESQASEDINDINELVLKDIDFTYEDLDLTPDELRAVNLYQNKKLVIGAPEIDRYYEVLRIESKEIEIGFVHLISESIKKVFGIETELVSGAPKDIISNVVSGNYDLTIGVHNSLEREKKLEFSNTSIPSNTYIYTNDPNMNNAINLNNLRIGRLPGVVFIDDASIKKYNLEMIEVKDVEEVLRFLDEGIIDAVEYDISSEFIQQGLLPIKINRFLKHRKTSFVTAKDNTIIALLNSAFDKMMNYKVSELMKNYDELYFNVKINNYEFFSLEEIVFINQTIAKPIKLYPHSNFGILSNNEDGDFTGIFPDIFREISKQVGWKYKFLENQYSSYGNLISRVLIDREDQGDGIFPFFKTDERDQFTNFSISLHNDFYVLVGKSDMHNITNEADIDNYKIGIVSGYPYLPYLQENFVDKEFYEYQNNIGLINAIDKGDVEYGVFNTETETEYILYDMCIKNLSIKYQFQNKLEVAFGLKDSERSNHINSIINKVVYFSDFSAIIKDYNDMIDPKILEYKRTMRYTIIIISVFALSMISIMSFAYMKLNGAKKIFQESSLRDELTGIRNRRALFTQYGLKQLVNCTVAFIDLDNLKTINDKFGHDKGDDYIKESAEIFEKIIGDVYRIGGDEFAIVSKESAIDLKISFEAVKKEHPNVSISVGIATNEFLRTNNFDLFLSYADYLMYISKKSGKNIITICSEENCKSFRKSLNDNNNKKIFRER